MTRYELTRLLSTEHLRSGYPVSWTSGHCEQGYRALSIIRFCPDIILKEEVSVAPYFVVVRR